MEEVFVGIDAGRELHCLYISDVDGNEIAYREFSTNAARLFELRDYLLSLCKRPENIHVAIEDPAQTVVDVLLDVKVSMWSINPKKTARLREIHWSANVKDDRRDAFVMADELRLRKTLFTRIERASPLTASLLQLRRFREDRLRDKVSEENQLTEILRYHFPQYLELKWSVQDRVMLDLLDIISQPCHLKNICIKDVEKAIGRARKHSAQKVVTILKNSPLPLEKSLLNWVSEMIKMRVKVLRELTEQIAKLEQDIAQILSEMDEQSETENGPSDVKIILSLPGVGPYILAALLAEGGLAITQRNREMLRLKSIAPVTSRTGNQGRKSANNRIQKPPVSRRYQGNRDLQDALFHLGKLAPQNSPHYKARYDEMRERGHTHGRACRQIADQILSVMFAMLRDKTLYDPAMHGATRRKNITENVQV